ncbi:hypothetical protein SAMN04488096_103297 [Mesonia phycicola]|uniref:Uncharacterized protein n=1 Tax=Mesonia phycicola TaxID=579105 RepID=A0A1M6D4H9_9FLAO|nr:hypothetical protein [Mesonia phycicola]SHI68182.1 hypothetical protein SAMN04488096_103297 [Mesonia phycicola]
MKKTIINSKFTGQQKLMLTVFMIIAFLIGLPTLIYLFIEMPGQPNYVNSFSDYFFSSLFFVSIFLFMLLFSKQGIITDNGNLKYSLFIFGIPFLSKKINLENITDITILTYRASQKLAWVSVANPDLSVSTEISKVVLLNSNHSYKDIILITRRRDYAEKIIKSLNEELNLEYNIYSPPVISRRRR